MKNPQLLLTRFYLAAALSLIAAVRAQAQDVAKVSPETHRVLLENERVRVLDVHFKVGEMVPTHSHPAGILYYLSDAKLRITYPDGRTEERQVKAQATLVTEVKRTAAQAYNVVVKVEGSNPTLAPLVVMAPRSAWWQSVSEQGSRLACWLEAIRVLAAGHPARDCFFAALSGHELGLLGIDPYIKRRPNLVKRAHAWIFFGSDIGAPRQPNLIHASDDVLERWTVAAMAKEGLTANGKARHDSIGRGEAGVIQQGGGRFVTIACGSEVYHSVADRWPEAVDVATLARYAKAFANGAIQLAAANGL